MKYRVATFEENLPDLTNWPEPESLPYQNHGGGGYVNCAIASFLSCLLELPLFYKFWWSKVGGSHGRLARGWRLGRR